MLNACSEGVWNNPYPSDRQGDTANVIYSSFSERPKRLDPVSSYSSNEYQFIAQIYEPPLQYHYLLRPYTLVPLTASRLPEVRYFGENEVLVDENAIDSIQFSEYTIKINKGIQFQPHPAFAKNDEGNSVNLNLIEKDLEEIHTLSDFEATGSRELTAEDYVYQIKRVASPYLHSPIAGVMREYIVGFDEFRKQASEIYPNPNEGWQDLRDIKLTGVSVVDRYTYRVRIKGKYPQLVYWMAMPFFAPMPWEAEKFYAQDGMEERNISLNWYPVGTGPYMLTENNPNLRMVMEKNPNFHDERYPSEGETEDRENGLLKDAGKRLPLVDKAVYSLEKETIPYWSKFLQGYYDASSVSSDSFDQAIQFGSGGDLQLTELMQEKGIQLATAVTTSILYMGFNMIDPVVGGESEQSRLLRRAISIAVDYEEYISIFANGRGVAAQSPIPPGIFGNIEGEAGLNPFVYDWKFGEPKRKDIEVAIDLMKQAGYEGGIDPKTNKPLVLNFDTPSAGPDAKAQLNWMRKQYQKLGIQLVIRATDYNRFQEKMRNGTSQIFQWGWNADYPDPENFFFLLYGPNGKVKEHGENAANYANPEFDRLFEKMKNIQNGPGRLAIIKEMTNLVQQDAPWLWGFHPKAFSLFHDWYQNVKPNLMANNLLKYKRVVGEARQAKREAWNKPNYWPLIFIGLFLLASLIPAVISFRKRERSTLK
ncbi:MAG: peptide ABC transporter substrate-binding protein [Gammaproteobacteria bacterium]|nr:MAG: peptide ABC transporter substrate-binding protein [Gammaproteobacteria bacterium]